MTSWDSKETLLSRRHLFGHSWVVFWNLQRLPFNDFESFAFDHSATSPNRAEPCRRRLGPRGCGACSRAGSAQSSSAPHPTRPSTFCATEKGCRTGRRFWWAGLRDVASTAGRKGAHVGAHALLAEAVAAAPHLQLHNNWAVGRTAKDQAWAAELPTGQHLHLRAQLLPTAGQITSRNGIKQHHPIQARQSQGLAQTLGTAATAWSRLAAHQSAAAAMAHIIAPSLLSLLATPAPDQPANAALAPKH